MTIQPKPFAAWSLTVLFSFLGNLAAFDKEEWNVRCWDSEKRLWVDSGIKKMTFAGSEGITKVTNTSGIHKHAHLIFSAKLSGDFTFTIEVKGGYELGFLNREGKDEMLYLEVESPEKFVTYELSRVGSRFTIKRDGRARPLVHFGFDYGEDFVITLALKDGESAEVLKYTLEAGSE
ncbi:hypothetical protein N9Y55_00185 [bacterium]|jgi:hypothetical protein|nr:hypothetical protein [bacterium]